MTTQESGSILPVAAFDAGHLFNTLTFFLTLEWFGARVAPELQAGRLAGELARRARLLRTTAESRAAIMVFVRDAIGALERTMSQEWHHESLMALAEHISAPNLPANEDFDREATRVDDCRSFATPVRDKLDEIRRALIDELGMRERLAFELGELVDRGLRRAEIGEHSFKFVTAPDKGAGSSCHISLRDSGEFPPEANWLQDVALLARELGIDTDMPEGPEIRSWLEPTVDPALVDRLVMAIRGALGRLDQRTTRPGTGEPAEVGGHSDGALPDGADSQDAPTRPSYLGLILDERYHQVRREGSPEVVELPGGTLNWALLKKFVALRGTLCPRAQLRLVWRDLDLDDGILDGTMNDAVSTLSRALKPLGVRIKSMRKVGWRLEEIQ